MRDNLKLTSGLAIAVLCFFFIISSTVEARERVFYYHNDHLGTPQVLTDDQGTVVWSAEYEPFGRATITTSTITNNLRFPGQYYDAETGLHYNWHRVYDPETGRYLQPDPIGLKGGTNLYAYALDNPILFDDALGLLVQLCARQAFSGDWGKKHKVYVIPHCYVVAGDDIFSWNIERKGGIHGNEKPGNNSCSTVPCCGHEDEFEACVKREAAADRGNEGNVWVPAIRDCCTWAHDVVGKCKKQYCQ